MQPALDEDEWQELQEERQNLVDEIRALKRAKDEDTGQTQTQSVDFLEHWN